MDTQLIINLIPVAGLLALGYAFLRARWVGQQEAGNERMAEIAAAISEGARAFLNREYRVLAIFVVAVAALLATVNLSNPQSSPLVAVSFVTGALCSALAGFIGMTVATKANVRTTQAARTGLAACREAQGDLEGAARDYVQYADENPDSPPSALALMQAARCYGQLGDAARRRETLERVTRQHPLTPVAQRAREQLTMMM